MTPDLADFANHGAGWTYLKGRLDAARVVFLGQAARATDDHARALGKLEGIEHALTLIEKIRAEMRPITT